MRPKILALVPLVACAVGCAATNPGLPPESAAAVPMTGAEIVAARQAAFNLSAPVFGGVLRTAAEGTGEVKGAAFAARGLARWAAALPTMFHPNTRFAQSRALPTVWSDRAGFDAQAALFQTATAQLLAAAQANDKAAFQAAYKATGAACASCHSGYRAEEAR